MELPNLEHALVIQVHASVEEFISLANYNEECTDFWIGDFFVESSPQLTKQMMVIMLHDEKNSPGWTLKMAIKSTPSGHADFLPVRWERSDAEEEPGVIDPQRICMNKNRLEEFCSDLDQFLVREKK